MKFLLSSASVAAALCLATSANAAVVFTSSAFDAPLAPGQTVVLNFNSTTPPAGYSITGTSSGYYTGTSSSAAAPANDTTQYYAVNANGTATISFPSPVGSLSLYIGSIDGYNSIRFNTSTGSQLVTGAQLTANPNGDQGAAATNRRYYFSTNDGSSISSATFISTQDAFEFDNLATGAVPETATWLMMIAGFGMIGASIRRRKMTTTVRYA